MTSKITARDIQILLASARYGEKQAAIECGIEYQSVKNNLYALYKKMGARSMAHAILLLSEGKVKCDD
jgi:DNA-binding CsgD family transcriptional regulator